jgi:hypothetical protein
VRRQTSNAKEPSELERRECVCDLYVCLFYAPEPAIRTVPVIELASMLLDELIAVDLLSWSYDLPSPSLASTRASVPTPVTSAQAGLRALIISRPT